VNAPTRPVAAANDARALYPEGPGAAMARPIRPDSRMADPGAPGHAPRVIIRRL